MQATASYDVIIVGAGAAGLMCAAQAGKRGRRVLLVDKAEKIGKKILISGVGDVISPILAYMQVLICRTTHTSANLH